ncbi:hypothetical protein DPMN_066655 [Dreissena polymorpha]|uniref:Uncharacterized protein n=1 Tax=Dreissena polymorpha TaxID=45954 RepID=A0A9D3YY95_DREPO|nr:hypothetical protein DPMN_066655 [Dreissena polymorpha]
MTPYKCSFDCSTALSKHLPFIQSHILGPFRQTSDKYLEGDSMNTHFGSGIAVYLRGPTRIKIT